MAWLRDEIIMLSTSMHSKIFYQGLLFLTVPFNHTVLSQDGSIITGLPESQPLQIASRESGGLFVFSLAFPDQQH